MKAGNNSNRLYDKKASFAQAGEEDVSYYGGVSWKESAGNAELLRQVIDKK